MDLISYKVTATQPTFRIEEAAVGSGDKCGATYVDKVWPFIENLGGALCLPRLGIPVVAREMDRTCCIQTHPTEEDTTWLSLDELF